MIYKEKGNAGRVPHRGTKVDKLILTKKKRKSRNSSKLIDVSVIVAAGTNTHQVMID